MPGNKPITPAQRDHYFTLRQRGWSQSQAAPAAGFSLASGKRLEGDARNAAQHLAVKNSSRISDTPIAEGALTDAVQSALADTTGVEWMRRYFGMEMSRWQKYSWQAKEDAWASPDRSFVVENVAPGLGKALALDTPLPTPSGWTTIKDVEVGDEVLDDRGLPCRVLGKSEIFYGRDCFEVSTDDGWSVIADAAHEWPVRVSALYEPKSGPQGPKATAGGIHMRETRDLARPRGKRPRLKMSDALQLPDALLPIEPYLLGIWLGDGHSAGGRITMAPDDAVSVRAAFEASGYRTTNQSVATNFGIPGLTTDLRGAGVLDNKHIPEAYLRGSAQQRLALLQGLIDTDGYVSPQGSIEFVSTSRRLADGVRQLVVSLGVKAGLAEGRAMLRGRDCGPKYRVTFYLADAARLPRKAIFCRNGERTPLRYLTATPTASVPTQCIEVESPSHLFLAGEGMLVTHNSTGLVGFAAKLIAIDRSTRGLFISRARSLAVRNTLRLRRMLERVTPVEGAQATLAGDFGRFRADIGGDIWTQDAFVVVQADGTLIEEKEPTCSAFGFDSEWLGNRLNWVFGDDLDSTRGIVNIDIVERNREVFDNELEPRLEPGGMFYLAQQRLGAYDFSSHVLAKRSFPDDPEELGDLTANFEDDPDKDGTRQYDHVVFKAHYDEMCKGRDTHKPGAPSWPDGCLLDPLRLSWKDLRKAMSKPYYRTVYQQEDPVETEALVQKIWIEGGDGHIGCWDKDRNIWQIPQGLQRPLFGVITVDPSPTRFWSVQAWVVGPNMESRYLVDLYRGRMEAPDFLDWSSMLHTHTGLVEDWRYNFQRMGVPLTHVVVEINAAQRFMLQYEHFQTWQRNHSIRVLPHSTQRNKSDPEFGIQMLAPHWEHGHVRLPGAGQGRITSMPLVREVLRWPHAPSDDCVLGQWFLEFNLPQLQRRARATRGGVVDPRRPSWAVA